MSSKQVALFAGLILVTITGRRAYSQDLPDLAQGIQPYVGFHGGEIDQVNTLNGGLTVRIGLISYPQKGSNLSLSYSVVFNSFGFEDVGNCINAQGVTGPIATIPLNNGCTNNVKLIPTGIQNNLPIGPRLVADQTLVAGGIGQVEYPDLYESPTAGRFYVITSDNAEHPLGLANDGTYRSIDGSSFMFVPSVTPAWGNGNLGVAENAYTDDETRLMSLAGGTITDSHGTVYTSSAITDVDGNQIAISNSAPGFTGFYAGLPATDSTGRTIPAPTTPNGNAVCPTIPQAQNQPSAGAMGWVPPGSGQGYLFCFASVAVNSAGQPQFAKIGNGGGSSQYSNTISMLQSIVLPNGTYWGFVYDSYDGTPYHVGGASTGSGNLLTLIYPTGGTVSYNIQSSEGLCDSGRESGLVPASIFTYPPQVISRTMADPGTGWTGTTTYTYPYSSNGTTGSILSPAGDLTVTNWTGDGSGAPCGFISAGQNVYHGNPSSPSSATPLKSTTISYTATTPAPAPYVTSARISQETTVLNGTNTSTVQYGYAPGVSLAALSCNYYGANCTNGGGISTYVGGETSKTYSDYSGSTLKTDVTAYEWQQPSSPYFTSNLLDLPYQTWTLNGAGCSYPYTSCQAALTTYTYDETAYSTGGTRGHPTTITRWLGTGTSPTTHTGWNSMGMKSYFIDANANENSNGHTIDYSYTNTAAGCNGSVVTGTTNALNQTISGTYDCNTGLLQIYSDLNNQETTFTYDSMRRLRCVEYPDGGSTAFDINDSLSALTVDKVTRLSGGDACQSIDGNIDEQYAFDGLGRQIHSRLLSDPYGPVYTDTLYDLMGRVQSVSNPYRTTEDATYGLTTYGYDALGRKVKETEADNSVLQWCYDNNTAYGQTNCHSMLGSGAGEWVDSSDEDGNDWQHVSDSLGRLGRVYEPNGSSATPSLETIYGYDALSNLNSVSQCGGPHNSCSPESRSFTSDSLSRLTSSTNPESGTITYSYDANGNLQTKTSPAVNVSSGTQTIGYCYDALNRPTFKFYTGTFSCSSPSGYVASYSYDGAGLSATQYPKGHLTDEKTYAGATVQTERRMPYYDAMGRAVSELQCVAGFCTSSTPPSPPSSNCSSLSSSNGLSYCYDFAGDVTAYSSGLTTSVTGNYPQAAMTFSQMFDTAGRLTSVSSSWNDSTHPSTLFSQPSYAPFGALTNWQLGEGLLVGRTYDSRQRITGQSGTQE